MRVLLALLCLLAALPVARPARAQCASNSPITMHVEDSYGFSFPTEDLGPLGATAAALTLCDGFEWGLFGASISAQRNNSTFDMSLNFSLTGAIGSVLEHMENGHIHVDPASVLYPDCSATYRAPDQLVDVHGSASLYTFAIGSTGGLFGEGIQHVQVGRFSLDYCDDVVIVSSQETTIEQSVGFAASLFASNASLGEPESTYAIAQANLSGTVMGQPIAAVAKSADSHTDLVAQTDLNEARVVPITVHPGENHYPTQVHADFLIRVSAKSQGLAGTTSGAATGGVTLPGSLVVHNFTAPGGAPLPDGLRIVSASSGQVYTASSVTAVGSGAGFTGPLRVRAPWPNPSSGAARMGYELGRGAVLSVEIWDAAGRRVRTLQSATFTPAGRHELAWDGLDASGHALARGLYLVRFRASGHEAVARVVRD